MKDKIKELLQSYYTQPKAYRLALEHNEYPYFLLQCKRYSIDVDKLVARIEEKERQKAIVSKMTAERTAHYSKLFS